MVFGLEHVTTVQLSLSKVIIYSFLFAYLSAAAADDGETAVKAELQRLFVPQKLIGAIVNQSKFHESYAR